MMRNSVILPKNRITQGTIFCGVKSSYPSVGHCYGICITARCDTARDFKAPNLTFLPIIPMRCWLWEEALPKAILDQKKASIGALKKYLIRKYNTTTILESFGAEKAFDSVDQKDKEIKSHRLLFDEALAAEKAPPNEWKLISPSIVKKVEAEGNLLISGKIQDFHFIDSVEATYGIDEQGKNEGFVVSFRDIRALSRSSAQELKDGIDAEKLKILIESDPSLNHLYADDEVIIYPTGELSSPYIEQLMQNFSLVFGRIGTQNVPPHYADNIQKLIRGEN